MEQAVQACINEDPFIFVILSEARQEYATGARAEGSRPCSNVDCRQQLSHENLEPLAPIQYSALALDTV